MPPTRIVRPGPPTAVATTAPPNDERAPDRDTPTATGNPPPGSFPAADPHAQVALVLAAWEAGAELQASTVARMGVLAERFAQRLTGAGVLSVLDATLEHCTGFVDAATRRGRQPSLHTMHLRRTTLRTLYRTITELDGPDLDPTRGLHLPPKTQRSMRPLSDDEMSLLRTTALARHTRHLHAATVIALGEATASTGEMARVRWRHVDLDTGVIALPGAGRVRPRPGALTPWGVGVLHRHRHATEPGAAPDASLISRSAAGPDSHTAQASVVGLLRRLFDAAGLAAEPDIKPNSLRLWAPNRLVNDGHGIDEAARRLGIGSLDATADLLGWDWAARA